MTDLFVSGPDSPNLITFTSEGEYIVQFLTDGSVIVNEKYTSGEAAKAFWEHLKGEVALSWAIHRYESPSEFERMCSK